MSKIQAVLFEKRLWTTAQARSWLKKHHIKPMKKTHSTNLWYRYRIRDPDQFRRMRVIKLGNGLEFIIGFY